MDKKTGKRIKEIAQVTNRAYYQAMKLCKMVFFGAIVLFFAAGMTLSCGASGASGGTAGNGANISGGVVGEASGSQGAGAVAADGKAADSGNQTQSAKAEEAKKTAAEAEKKRAEEAAENAETDPAALEAAEKAKAEADAKAKANAAEAARLKAEAEAKAAEERRIKALQVAVPSVSPASGVFKGGVKVTISCATPEAKITWTLDGSEPSQTNGVEYTGPVQVGASSILKVLAWVPKGNTAEIQVFDYTVDEVCVTGGANGDGTRSRPLGKLAKAVELAKATGISTIKLGPDALNESIELVEPLSYLGGWDRHFAKKTGKRSVIAGVPMEGSGKKSPGYGIKLSGTKVAGGKFDSLELRGGEAGYTSGALLSDKTNPTFTNCLFVGGTGNYGYGALIIGQAAPSFVGCSFDGGTSASGYGVSVDSASATLSGCIAFAGAGTVTGAGVMVTDGKITASNSVLAGNVANTGYGLALYNSKGSKIEACTLWGGSGRDATALFVSVGDPVVSSCILGARGKKVSYGIHDNYGDSAPSVIKNVAFTGCASALYYDVDTKSLYTMLDDKGAFSTSAGKALAKPVALASVFTDLALGDVPGLRTPAGVVPAVAGGGLASSMGTVDAGGSKRTEPWSIGAWEVEP